MGVKDHGYAPALLFELPVELGYFWKGEILWVELEVLIAVYYGILLSPLDVRPYHVERKSAL